ncbi:RDD family protein [Archangium sp.]|uniref:RDD family protein n=1 Tax=Archangium sp. TaxID=1872627 RepID=UPI00286D5FDC|nr:RDD family protein [Archangium sp.]
MLGCFGYAGGHVTHPRGLGLTTRGLRPEDVVVGSIPGPAPAGAKILAQGSGLDVPEWTGWLWFLGYYLVCEALWGCRLGKWLMGLRVVDAQGHAPGWANAARRTLTRFFEANMLLCGGLPPWSSP